MAVVRIYLLLGLVGLLQAHNGLKSRTEDTVKGVLCLFIIKKALDMHIYMN